MRNITKEDYRIASRYLFVQLTLSTIEVDLKQLQEQNLFKINEVYVNILEKIHRIGINERRGLKKLLKQNDIQIVLTTKREVFTEYTEYCIQIEPSVRSFEPLFADNRASECG